MWILRWILIALIIFVLLGFSLQNTQETSVTILKWSTGPIPMYLIVFLSFAVGLCFFLLIGIYHQLRQGAQLRKYRREIKQLNNVINDLQQTSSAQSELSDNEPSESTGAKSVEE